MADYVQFQWRRAMGVDPLTAKMVPRVRIERDLQYMDIEAKAQRVKAESET